MGARLARQGVEASPQAEARRRRLQSWERRTEWPLAGLAVLFLVAYAWPILDPHLAPRWTMACSVATWIIWAVFAADYLTRLRLAPDRPRFVRSNLADLAVILLPMLRPLRMLRLVLLLKAFTRAGASGLRGRVGSYLTGGVLVLGTIAALAVLDAERASPDANITSFSDALWWAITTMTTVGYGDQFPVTNTGRMVAAGLMVGGIALLGTVTALLASWLAERVAMETEDATAPLVEEVRALRREIEQLRGAQPVSSGDGS